jgi:hypothetical protein
MIASVLHLENDQRKLQNNHLKGVGHFSLQLK